MNAGQNELAKLVVGNPAAAAMASQVAQEALKLRVIDEEEMELLAVWNAVVSRLKGFTAAKSGYGDWQWMDCVTLALRKGYEARREILKLKGLKEK